MGKEHKSKRKRKNSDIDKEILRKIRRLEKEVRRNGSHERDRKRHRRHRSVRSRSDSGDNASPHRSRSRSPRDGRSRSISGSDHSRSPTPSVRNSGSERDKSPEPNRDENENPNMILDKDILEALGDPKSKEEEFGPQIPDELSKRWERILRDGLTKEQRQEILDKTLVPENFRLVKAPILNPEIAPVLSDSVLNRDKALEKSQNLLGMGISSLTQLTSSIVTSTDELNKIDIVKKLSEISQILLELHHDDTVSRRKLIITSLDKKFAGTIKHVKRDEYLFGTNLGDKIKALKSAEKSGLQIKRQDGTTSSSKRYNSSQGNWRGQPRSGPGQRGHRWSGQRGRPSNYQANRRPAAAATDHRPQAGKTNSSKANKS